MPTSLLCGDYFSSLRGLVSRERPLLSLRFVQSRSAVFERVLQETCLGVFGPCSSSRGATVYGDLAGGPRWSARVHGSAPWLIARSAEDADLLAMAVQSPYRLSDYGFAVHTGPLVWNRHRRQLRADESTGTLPNCLVSMLSQVGSPSTSEDRVALNFTCPWRGCSISSSSNLLFW